MEIDFPQYRRLIQDVSKMWSAKFALEGFAAGYVILFTLMIAQHKSIRRLSVTAQMLTLLSR